MNASTIQSYSKNSTRNLHWRMISYDMIDKIFSFSLSFSKFSNQKAHWIEGLNGIGEEEEFYSLFQGSNNNVDFYNLDNKILPPIISYGKRVEQKSIVGQTVENFPCLELSRSGNNGNSTSVVQFTGPAPLCDVAFSWRIPLYHCPPRLERIVNWDTKFPSCT